MPYLSHRNRRKNVRGGTVFPKNLHMTLETRADRRFRGLASLLPNGLPNCWPSLACLFTRSREPTGRPRLFGGLFKEFSGVSTFSGSKMVSARELSTIMVSFIPLVAVVVAKIGSIMLLFGSICSIMGIFCPFFERGFEIFTLIGTLSVIIEALLSFVG